MLSRFLQPRHIASTWLDQRRAIIDLAVIVPSLAIVYWLADVFDLYDKLDAFIDAHNTLPFDEGVIVALLGVIGLIIFGARRFQDQRREITARQRAEDRAQYLALADTLTGLPNRRQFENRLASALNRMRGDHAQFALMMIDLDRFKPVNDVFGHAVGDQVLIAFSKRVSALIGSESVLARFGGDEFALLLGPIVDVEEPTRLARRIVAAVARPFDAASAQVTLGTSIGVAVAPQDGAMADELLRRADIALYRAKTSGRNTFRFFEEEMDAQVKRRAQIEHDLRRAIDEGTVRPYYQPIIDLKDGEILGFEALARWHHPAFGDLEPEQFIAIAEDAGMIIPLSDHLLRCAARDAATWPASIKLSFNISRMQLADPMLVLRILHVLAETGLSPTRLEVEISEDALVSEVTAAKEALSAFHAAGVRIALDDFGTGNSSLRHLRECHFDRLKIDRSFVQSMIASNDSATFVNAILDLSKALGLPVSAEGIEDEAVIAALRAHGCSEGQGFRFSEAVPADEALRLLDRKPQAVASR